jgi:hypothetical protein
VVSAPEILKRATVKSTFPKAKPYFFNRAFKAFSEGAPLRRRFAPSRAKKAL